MALNVLVVDDSVGMRSILIKTLRLTDLDLGEVSEAGNGVEALEILRGSWVDLAMVDINMPVMNGEELIDAIRKDEALKDLPILIVSSESSMERIELLMRKETGFVHKPFSPESLRDAILETAGKTRGTHGAH
jgi:two-component system chemotaxis response regulator CheY